MDDGPKATPPKIDNGPGGWSFFENGKWITGENPADLIRKVSEDREANGVGAGDPEYEIKQYYDRHFPDRNYFSSKNECKEIDLRDRVIQWYRQISLIPQVFSGPEEAEKRASVCASCPHNVQIDDTGLTRTSMIIRRGQSTKTQVKYCDILSQDNSAAVFLELPAPQIETPSFCWRRK